MDLLQTDAAFVAGTYKRLPVTITHGEGAIAWAGDENAYLDFTSGIGVNALGWSNPGWLQAVEEQLHRFAHLSNYFACDSVASLAKLLCKRTGFDKVFFSNSGAEANECAIKVARKYAATKHGAHCFEILTLENSFHGRTLTTLAATGQETFHKDFLPLTPGFSSIPANDIKALQDAVSEKTAAILLEPIQGEGGVNELTGAFVEAARKICDERDILLLFDEVQTGNGRTGKLYAYEHFGIRPDLLITAKGLSGGLPLGATLMDKKCSDVLQPGDHGTTFGGNPVACAGAKYIMETMDEAFLESVNQKGDYVREKLTGAKGVRSVSGKGLMIGIETEKSAAQVQKECLELGLLVLTAKHKVRLLPPLNIDFPLLARGIDLLLQVLAD